MITAEEFFRNKIKEKNPNIEVVTLSRELITAEEGMRWAHEFKQLHSQAFMKRSEQLVAFVEWLENNSGHSIDRGWIEEYIKATNCA